MVDRRTLAFFAVTSLFFGGTFVAAKAGLQYIPPLLFVAFRFDIAAVLLLGYVLATNGLDDVLPRTAGDWAGILATGLLAIGGANALLFLGQQSTSSGVGSIVFSLNPILTPVFAALLLSDERLSARGTVGLLVGLVGVALVVHPDPANLLGTGALGKGLIFLGAASGALGTVLVRRADSSLSSTVRTAWALPLSALLCHALSLVRGESLAAVNWQPEALAAIVYVGTLAGAVTYFAYFGLIDEVGAIRANLVFYVIPIVATLGGAALLGEEISTLTVVGFATIFAGFAVLGSESIAGGVARMRRTLAENLNAERVLSMAVYDSPNGSEQN